MKRTKRRLYRMKRTRILFLVLLLALALSACGASSGGGEPVVVQIYFQIEGNATPDTVQQLRQYGDEFVAQVRRVMDVYARDMARRR